MITAQRAGLRWLLAAIVLTAALAVPSSGVEKKSGKTKAAPAKASKTTTTKKADTIARNPYLGAIVMDADSGQVLFEDNADGVGYPASVLKLMDLLIVLEKAKAGQLKLDDKITVTAEVCGIGGTQVWLKEHEVFSVDELLYALMIRSANDAALALALHAAGSKDAFVELMNQRAAALGMKSTKFHSVHGLPPASGGMPDVTTARDLALLARELLRHPETLQYTSVREKVFRQNPLTVMQTHNRLLGKYEGCDGLKTGYFSKAGFSLVATAKRNDRRLIAVLLGSTAKEVRDPKAAELLSKGFAALGGGAKPAPLATAAAVTGRTAMAAATPATDDVQAVLSLPDEQSESDQDEEEAGPANGGRQTLLLVFVTLAVAMIILATFLMLRRKDPNEP
ncbi:MAG: D-alanyl-D-alanine carboxypeptidase [Lentisphaerae bacterium]|nr:D-alanyl-D-alanine carboxypeptidase [Lentisphaerota bacterium]